MWVFPVSYVTTREPPNHFSSYGGQKNNVPKSNRTTNWKWLPNGITSRNDYMMWVLGNNGTKNIIHGTRRSPNLLFTMLINCTHRHQRPVVGPNITAYVCVRVCVYYFFDNVHNLEFARFAAHQFSDIWPQNRLRWTVGSNAWMGPLFSSIHGKFKLAKNLFRTFGLSARPRY